MRGASEFVSTINGIGGEQSNASFEECVVGIYKLFPQFSTDIKIHEIYTISKLVARFTGVYIQPNKAVLVKMLLLMNLEFILTALLKMLLLMNL